MKNKFKLSKSQKRYHRESQIRRLKSRIHHYAIAVFARLFLPQIWKLAKDIDQIYYDMHYWDYTGNLSELYEIGLPESRFGAVISTVVSIFHRDDVYDPDNIIDSFYKDGEDDELLQERIQQVQKKLIIHYKKEG